jgi:hypothetical protein
MAAPTRPSRPIAFHTQGLVLGPATALRASACSARMPPSPSWSARSTNTTYFSVTTNIRPQKISDSSPSTESGENGTPCSGFIVSLKA